MSNERPARHPVRGQPAPAQRFNGDAPATGAAEHGPNPDVPADATQPQCTEPEGLKLLLQQFQELREYVSCYAAARTDSVKCAVRNAIGRLVLAALGFVAVGGLIIIACWFVLSGIAQGAAAFFGGQAWIGNLLTGALTLAGVALAIACATWARKNAARKRTVRKYETRQAQQRARFGRDVHDETPAAVVPPE